MRAIVLRILSKLPVLLLVLTGPSAQGQSGESIEGFSHPYRTARVAAASSGIVLEWLVEEGQQVSAGQALIQLDDTLHRQQLAIAKAAYESQGELALTEAEHQLREQRLAAIEALARQGHATPDELHRAQTEARVAAARLLSAQEHRRTLKLEYDKLQAQAETYTVTAPFDGVVNRVTKFKGEFVGPVEPEVCELSDLTAISARFLVPQELLAAEQNGDTAQVYFPGTHRTVAGKLTLSPYPDAETGMRSVKVTIDNPDNQLKAGQPCRLLLGN